MDQSTLGDASFDDGLDRRLLNIGQHLQDDLAAALNHAENRRLFLFAFRVRARPSICCIGPCGLFFDGGGIALATGDDINLVDLDLARQDHRRSFRGQPFAQLRRHLLNVITFRLNSCAICRFERFSPMKYRHNIQTRSG